MKAIEKISITDLVVHNIKDLILSGKYKVGDKLPTEKQICTELNVGRSTVREAFRVLQAIGLIQMIKGRGAFVAKTKEDDPDNIVNWFVQHKVKLTDFIEVRMAIEPLAIKLCIERASQDEIKEIEEVYNAFEEAFQNYDSVKLALNDEAFHNTIIEMTHNQLLIMINKNIVEAFREYRNRSFSVSEIARNALVPHKSIVDAIKARDVDKGVNEMIHHLNISLQDISKVVEKKSLM
ncbi:FadR/GntR family transcriptional regulator [Petroclostridium sp. X23]|uniref:FadR/GntR family transcriptional regulator n=1 Tax=Petroclostridium sp. X23 TaxID=3045146 RepID=UPI0024AD1ADE|nr:FadR/GntR family transcriptional regulator [Petroclostridium sp. X23]WHH58034.1 FadR/GntR family transcriptional regulator [Petroclostridium sp. X23]